MHPLQPSALQFQKHSGHEKQRVMLPSGVPEAHLTDPFFWSFVARRLAPFDEIQVIPEDGSWIAEYYVVQVGDNWARVIERSRIVLESVAEEDEKLPAGYELKFGGPVVGWSILRGADRLFPQKPYTKAASKLDALNWLKNNVRNLAA